MKKITKSDFKRYCILAFKKLLMLVCILVFLSLFTMIFGNENALTGVALCTAFTIFIKADLSVKPLDGALFLFFGLCIVPIAAHYSLWNPYVGILVDLAVLFLIMTISTEVLAHKNYISFILFYAFDYGNPVYGKAFGMRLLATAVCALVIALTYFLIQRRKSASKKTILRVIREVDFRSDRAFFIYRMTLSLAAGMLIGNAFGFVRSMWIPLTIMSVTQLTVKDTLKRSLYRPLGTLFGAAMFFLLVSIDMPNGVRFAITMLLSYVYSFVRFYPFQMFFVTINSLNAATSVFPPEVAFYMRLILIAIGIGIVFFFMLLELLRRYLNTPVQKLKKQKHAEDKSGEDRTAWRVFENAEDTVLAER